MASTYAYIKRRRQEQRRLDQISELTLKVGNLAMEIYAIDDEHGQATDPVIPAAVREAFSILRASHGQ